MDEVFEKIGKFSKSGFTCKEGERRILIELKDLYK